MNQRKPVPSLPAPPREEQPKLTLEQKQLVFRIGLTLLQKDLNRDQTSHVLASVQSTPSCGDLELRDIIAVSDVTGAFTVDSATVRLNLVGWLACMLHSSNAQPADKKKANRRSLGTLHLSLSVVEEDKVLVSGIPVTVVQQGKKTKMLRFAFKEVSVLLPADKRLSGGLHFQTVCSIELVPTGVSVKLVSMIDPLQDRVESGEPELKRKTGADARQRQVDAAIKTELKIGRDIRWKLINFSLITLIKKDKLPLQKLFDLVLGTVGKMCSKVDPPEFSNILSSSGVFVVSDGCVCRREDSAALGNYLLANEKRIKLEPGTAGKVPMNEGYTVCVQDGRLAIYNLHTKFYRKSKAFEHYLFRLTGSDRVYRLRCNGKLQVTQNQIIHIFFDKNGKETIEKTETELSFDGMAATPYSFDPNTETFDTVFDDSSSDLDLDEDNLAPLLSNPTGDIFTVPQEDALVAVDVAEEAMDNTWFCLNSGSSAVDAVTFLEEGGGTILCQGKPNTQQVNGDTSSPILEGVATKLVEERRTGSKAEAEKKQGIQNTVV